MMADNPLAEAERIIAGVDAEETVRDCRELGMALAQAAGLLARAGNSERSRQIAWESSVCNPWTQPSIYRSDGNPRFPVMPQVPEEAWSYLADRSIASGNPVLRSRYHDFLWEIGAPDKHKHALAAVDDYLVAAHQFARLTNGIHAVLVLDALDRSAHLSLALNSRERIEATIATALDVMEILKDEKTTHGLIASPQGRWTHEIALILFHIRQHHRHGGLVSDGALIRVREIAEGLAAHHRAINDFDAERHNLAIAVQAARLVGEHGGATRLAMREAESLEDEAAARATEGETGCLVAARFYEEAHKHYQRLLDDANTPSSEREGIQGRQQSLKQRIPEMYRQGEGAFKPLAVSLEIPREEYERRIGLVVAAPDLDTALALLGRSLVPNIANAQAFAGKAVAEHPLLALMPSAYVAHDMKVASTGSEEEERLRDEVERSLRTQIVANSQVLSDVLLRLCRDRGLDADAMLGLLRSWGVLESDNLTIIGTGLERYFAGDYVSALHILTPQFENALRTMFEKRGQGVIRPRSVDGGWQFELFGTFLAREEVKRALGDDLLAYIRIVMAEQTGWNLRNEVAHGMVKLDMCTDLVVNMVLHLYLALTQVPDPDEDQTDTGP